VTDDVDEAVAEILNFYSNYHSSRYVGERFVMRVRQPPKDDELAALNADFEDIVVRGAIELGSALPEENGEAAHLPRVIFHFNRRDRGRLRHLIDRLNGLVAEPASPPREALPHEIVPQRLPADAERDEAED
jgi:hypothetical protein